MKNIRKLCALMMALILMTVCMSMVSASEASSEGAEGDILQLDMEVGLDAKGSILYYEEVYVIPQGTLILQEGDMLCYDVRLLDEYGGFGAVDIACGYGDNGFGDKTLRDDAMSVDQNFLRCHPTVNLAGLCLNQWFAREVYLSSSFIEVANEQDLRILIAVDLPDASIMAGQTVNCQYDNIRIVRDGEIIYTIFADRENAIPEEPVYYGVIDGKPLDGMNEHVITDVYVNLGALDAEPSEPAPTEPKPTEPKPTEPKPTEPKPTEPATAPAADNTGLVIGIAAAALVVIVVAIVLIVRKKKA